MRRVWLYALVVMMTGFFLSAAVSAAEVPRMSTEDLKASLGRADLVVLDVRGAWDWGKSAEKIVGSVRVEPGAAAQWVADNAKGKVVVLYCA